MSSSYSIARPSRPVLVLLERLAILPLLIAAFATLPQLVQVGDITALAALTGIEILIACCGLLACASYPRRLVLRALPYWGFLLWALLSALWATPDREGIQNASVYLLFGLLVLFAGTISARDVSRMHYAIAYGIRWIDWIALSLVFRDVLLHGLPSGPDEGWMLSPRPVANLGLVVLCWHLSRWYHGHREARLSIFLWFIAIVLSMSRTGTGVALFLIGCVLLFQVRFKLRRALFNVPVLLVALCFTGSLMLFVTPFYNHFFTGDTKLKVGGFSINVSGRASVWSALVTAGQKSPIIGQGLGSSQALTSITFDNIAHPHNDYLRVWYDLGFVGIALLLLALGSWMWTLFRACYRAERDRGPPSEIEFAALLLLVAIGLIMIPDNALIYSTVMGPAGVLIGAALGARREAPGG